MRGKIFIFSSFFFFSCFKAAFVVGLNRNMHNCNCHSIDVTTFTLFSSRQIADCSGSITITNTKQMVNSNESERERAREGEREREATNQCKQKRRKPTTI